MAVAVRVVLPTGSHASIGGSNMHRTLERLDGLASTLVPLSYLVGLFLGTAAYLSGVILDARVAVGIGIAAGSELHSFLQNRRARASWGEYERLRREGLPFAAALSQFRSNVAILGGLVVFQCFTSVAFAAESWHPAPGFLPDWVQIGITGLIIPVLFLLSGFLAPLHQSPGAILSHASEGILHYAVSQNVRHWRRRIKRVHRRGGDLSPLMSALLTEAGDTAGARRTGLIAESLSVAEGGMAPRVGWWGRLWGHGRADTPVGALLGAPGSYVQAGLDGSMGSTPRGVQLVSSPAVAVSGDPSGDPEPEPPGPAPQGPGRGPGGRPRSRREPTIQLVEPPEWRAERLRQTRTTSTAGLDGDALAAQRRERVAKARAILTERPRISADELGELIGASKSAAAQIRRELHAEARGRRNARQGGEGAQSGEDRRRHAEGA